MDANMTFEEYKDQISEAVTTNSGLCPVCAALSVFNGKWKLSIIYELSVYGSMRFSEIKKVIGIVSGNGYTCDYLTMSYIKKRVMDEIQYGDVILTSGENDNYMKDIPIGTISSITALDYDTSLELQIIPVIDFNRLENVIVADFKNLAITD